jgi:apolipoprotein N-acyltransferase
MRKRQQTYFLISLLIVAFAQPDWSVLACILTSCIGYALFWQGVSLCKTATGRFGSAVIWFGTLSVWHLNWLLADRYVGAYIYLFIFLLGAGLGIQFGLITLFVRRPLHWIQVLGISGGWVLCEWSRLFILSGYTLDPVGLGLGSTLVGMQMASFMGVYGLSFWVIFTNLLAFRWMSTFFSFRAAVKWIAVALIPYAFGLTHLAFHTYQMKQDQQTPLKVLLVQTSTLPEEKYQIDGSAPLSPIDQWCKILALLAPHLSQPTDLIVLPEGVVPYGTYHPIYPTEKIEQAFQEILGREIHFPVIQKKVGNCGWAQALTNVTGADLILGLEDVDTIPNQGTFHAYNAAFVVHPFTEELARYEKRVLVPLGEYIPFNWCKKFLSKYGITDAYAAGREAKVFPVAHSLAGFSICYEETHGNLMRQSRQKGAELLVNLTNDVWYPRSRLPIIHFNHGRLRAVESGVAMLRACNTGVTCSLDARGQLVGQLPYDSPEQASQPAVLRSELPLYHYPTFYVLWGDAVPVGVCALFFIFMLSVNSLRSRSFLFNPCRKTEY